MKLIRLMIIEENPILRDGINSVLSSHSEFKVVGVSSFTHTFSREVQKKKPHIVLINLNPHNEKHIPSVKHVKEKNTAVKVIATGIVHSQSNISKLLHAGVSGFIMNDVAREEWIKTIHSVVHGRTILPERLLDRLYLKIIDHEAKDQKTARLKKTTLVTKRELEVIELIAAGLTNNEIAHKLHLSVYTVKSHVRSILRKLSVRTRVQIINRMYSSALKIHSAE